MNWQLLAAISVLTNSLSVVLQRVIIKDQKSDPVAYSIVFQLLTGILIGVYSFTRGFRLPDLQATFPNFLIMILLYGGGNIFIFKALKKIEASSFAILFAKRTIWAILGAILFLGESFSIQKAIGTGLILAGVVVVSWKKNAVKFTSGQGYALLAALAFGTAFVNDAFIVRNADVPSYLFLAFILPALAVWAVNPQSTVKMKPLFEKEMVKKLAVLTVLYSIAAITIFLAYQVGRNAAQIAPLQQSVTVVTVLLGIILLKERADLWKKIAGAILSFIGILLLI